MNISTNRRSIRWTALVACLPLALALAACSDSSDATAGTTAPSASASPESGSDAEQGGPGAQRTPGVTGEIAAVSGTTAQVQDGESQTAVTWSADTTITLTQTATAADVAEGSCVVVIGGEDAAATSVTVSDPVDGECTGGMTGAGAGGFGGQPPSGAPDDASGERPTGEPGELPEGESGDRPSGAPEAGEQDGEGPGGFGGSIVVGQVVSADATSLTVTTTADGTESEQTVTVDDATVYSVQRAAGDEDVAVGLCVSAQGESDSSGGLAAATLTLSEPGDEGCVAAGPGGLGGAGGPGQGPGAPQGEAEGDGDA